MANKKTALTPAQCEYIGKNEFYRFCIHENVMTSDIEQEHSLYFAGRKIQELFAIVPVRRIYNRNPNKETKDFHKWVAYKRLFHAAMSYKNRICENYKGIDFVKECRLLEDQYGWKLTDFPELRERIKKYRLTGDCP